MFKRTILTAVLAASPALAETWDLPLAWAAENYISVSADQFADEVRTATEGRVDIATHPAGGLGFKGPEMLSAVRDGLVPIGDMLLNQQVGDEPLFAIASLPYFISSFEELQQFDGYFREKLDEIMAKHNQKVLYTIPWPQQLIWTKTEITDLESMAGIKIRSYDRTSTDVFASAGMTPVQLPWGEVIPSLAAGTIDAVATSSPSAVDGSFWEFLGHGYTTRQTWNIDAVTVNLDAWNGLSEADQAAILEVAQTLEPQFWQLAQDEDAKNVEILAEKGVAVDPISDEMRAKLTDLAEPLRAEMLSGLGPDVAEFLDGFKAP